MVLGFVALTLSASAAVLYGNLAPGRPIGEALHAELHSAHPMARRAALPLDPSFMAPSFTGGTAPKTFAQTVLSRTGFVPFPSAPGGAAPEPVVMAQIEDQAIVLAKPVPAASGVAGPNLLTSSLPEASLPEASLPTPMPRPGVLAPAGAPMPSLAGRRHMARRMAEAAAASSPAAEARGVFDRLFGRAAPPSPALAYAAPEDAGSAGGAPTASDGYTAVYDIAAHTVTLPDGSRLEAHSGLGSRLDDPRSVGEHMRGATPPAVYDLEPREALFHGVRALRLNPVGGAPYGRLGLLAHTYMLGPRGDSNGCVVFRDYQAFRRAYDKGQVRRLVVVAARG